MMDLDDDDGAECQICLMPMLAEEGGPTGILKCGHTYHIPCIVSWLVTNAHPLSKAGSCPSCKAPGRPEDVRKLDFEMKTIERPSAEEVRRVQASTEAERAKQREEYQVPIREADAETAALQSQKEEVTKFAKNSRSSRKELIANAPLMQEESKELDSQVIAASARLSEFQANFDAQSKKFQRKLPIPRPKDADTDLRNERRMLRSLRPPERVRQLHDALNSTFRQEALSIASLNDHDRALQGAQASVDGLRRSEAKLKRTLSERSEAAMAQKEKAIPEAIPTHKDKARRLEDAAAARTSVIAGGKENIVGARKAKQVEVVDVTMAARVSNPLGDDDDEGLLFGTSRPGGISGARIGGSKFGSLLSRNNSGAGNLLAGSQGGLLSGQTRLGQPQKIGAMQSLFANRR